MLGEKLLAHPRLVIEAVQGGFRCDLYEIAIALFVLRQHEQMVVGIAFRRSALDVVIVFLADVKFAADDGLDVILVRRVYEVHSAEDIPVVGHGHGGHAKFFNALTKFFDVAGAVQQGIIGMEVQVDELGHRSQSHFAVGVILTGNAYAEAVRYPQIVDQEWKNESVLQALVRGGQTKIHTTLVVCFDGCRKIELREWNLLGALRRKIP